MDIDYDASKTLNPLAIYISAIEFLWYFVHQDWDAFFAKSYAGWAPGFNVEVFLANARGVQSAILLRVNHIIIATLQIVMSLARANKSCKVSGGLYFQRRYMGVLTIQSRQIQGNVLGAPLLVNDTIIGGNSTHTVNIVNAQSGVFRDNDEPDLTISYTFKEIRIEGKEVFTAILDALATAAQDGEETIFRSVKGIGASGDVEISILSEGPERRYRITNSYVYAILRDLVLDIMVKAKRFSEMTFEAQWKDAKVCVGSVSKIGNQPQALTNAR